MAVKHIICFSGGESSAITAVEATRRYGKESIILLNHDINPRYEDEDIKRFKLEVAAYLGVPITYANIGAIADPNKLPSQFQVCMDAGALTDQAGHALCTHRLKTEPFDNYLDSFFPTTATLFQDKQECIIFYGFDATEVDRIQRRTGILGIKGYKTDYILAFWKERTIFRISEIGISPPPNLQSIQACKLYRVSKSLATALVCGFRLLPGHIWRGNYYGGRYRVYHSHYYPEKDKANYFFNRTSASVRADA